MYLRGLQWIAGVLCAGTGLLAPAAWAAAEGEAHGGGGGLISLDWSLAVQMLNFVILLVLLQRLLYKPLLGKMAERTAAIKKSLDEAQAARAEAARQHAENEARLRAAYAEAAEIRAAALKEAAEDQRRLVEAARAESQRMVDGARAQIDAEVRRARQDLRREVSDLAIAVAEKLVHKSLREDDHRRIVDDAIVRLGP